MQFLGNSSNHRVPKAPPQGYKSMSTLTNGAESLISRTDSCWSRELHGYRLHELSPMLLHYTVSDKYPEEIPVDILSQQIMLGWNHFFGHSWDVQEGRMSRACVINISNLHVYVLVSTSGFLPYIPVLTSFSDEFDFRVVR